MRRLRNIWQSRSRESDVPRVCTRCSIAVRRARASSPRMVLASRAMRAMGHVAEAFDEQAFHELPGHLRSAIRATRQRGRAGSQMPSHSLIDCSHGQIAVAHNGNIVNARELRDELVRDGAIFQTSSDTEVLLHLSTLVRRRLPSKRRWSIRSRKSAAHSRLRSSPKID